MECWNTGILEEDTTGRDERLLVQGTQTRAPPRTMEGRALSRPATTKRGPPKASILFSHHSAIPIFHYSSEVIVMKNEHAITPWGFFENALLTVSALLIVGALILLPLLVILQTAFAEGVKVWLASVTEPDARSAIYLTLGVTAVVVPLNTLFGVTAAWAIARFRFKGRSLLLSLVDLPFAVSPVIAGLIFVLVFGRQGWFGEAFIESGYKVVFGIPGILLATLFVTFPFVARELIPLMTEQGSAGRRS
jgi:sulfate/thiosulfate transport system permease protein